MGCLLLSFAFHPPSPRHLKQRLMRDAKPAIAVTHHASHITFRHGFLRCSCCWRSWRCSFC
jgi:hypothetical protein